MSAARFRYRIGSTLVFGVASVAMISGACNPPPDVPIEQPPSHEDQTPTQTEVGDLLLASGNSLVTSGSHTCALLEGGLVKCWGDNTFGQLGHGTFGGQTQQDPLEDFSVFPSLEMFVNLGTGRTAKALAAGQFQTCAILDTNQLKCWGDNSRGQLGQGDTLPRGTDFIGTTSAASGMGDALPPINLGTGRTALAVATSGLHTCAILDNSQVKCWGQGEPARLGYGDNLDRGGDPGQMGDFLPVVDLGTGHTAKAIATTLHNTCVILENNHVKCWGFRQSCALGSDPGHDIGGNAGEMGDHMPEVNIGPSPRIATAIVAGGFHFCALRDDGKVICWGENAAGQIGDGTTNDRGCVPAQMGDAGAFSPFGTGVAVTALAAGTRHTCAMRSNGEVRCWGNNMNLQGSAIAGQLGRNTAPIPNTLLSPPSSSIVNVTARAVAGGGAHTCAITTANHARCWGANDLGQLGTNITATAVGDVAGEMSTLQESELGTRRIFQVVAGADHTCAILGSASPGPVKCWGYNGDGALGIGNTLDRGDEPNEMGTNLPTLALGTGRNAKWLAAGDGHTCAVLDNNTLKCWGRNDMGQEGMGDFTTRLSPSTSTVNLGSLRTAHATVAFPVAAGHEHTCIILDNSTVKCWGENTDGQLGYGDTTLRTAPDANAINLGTGLTAKAIATGVSYTCALLSNNTVKCWGRNDDGQLGYGDTAIRLSPPATSVNLGTGRTAKAIATGGTTTCAILDNNTVKCWGYNGSAQLGLGDTTPRLSPSSTAIDLGSGQTALSIDVGSQHVCVVLATNQVKCWGQNASGQLGTWQEMFDNFDTTIGERANEMGNFLAMVYQGAGRAVKAVTTGFAHTCFLLDSNQVRCTGTNFNGQLGQGNTNFYTPQFQGAGLVDLGPNP